MPTRRKAARRPPTHSTGRPFQRLRICVFVRFYLPVFRMSSLVGQRRNSCPAGSQRHLRGTTEGIPSNGIARSVSYECAFPTTQTTSTYDQRIASCPTSQLLDRLQTTHAKRLRASRQHIKDTLIQQQQPVAVADACATIMMMTYPFRFGSSGCFGPNNRLAPVSHSFKQLVCANLTSI